MHILLVADGRSPITRNWIEGLLVLNHAVTLVSTFPCTHIDGTQATYNMPIAFSQWGGSQVISKKNPTQQSKLRLAVTKYRHIFQSARSIFGPFTINYYAQRFANLVKEHKPDIVHALRIPFEGMLAANTPSEFPLVVSIWGNDLTLHAPSSPVMENLTHKVLHRANGLIADVQRDLRLSQQWGFSADRPKMVALTSGGIDFSGMERLKAECPNTLSQWLPEKPLVVNPRGLRPGYVRNDTFFQSIPLLLQRNVPAYFVCPSMEGQPEAIGWVKRLHIADHVGLLPYLTQKQLWELFIRSQISVSVTVHDGTPNTLLEAMVCGSFPIVGDIESLREWITPGINGLLVEPDQPQSLAEAMQIALENPLLRSEAAQINYKLVQQRADVNLIRAQLQEFYQHVLGKTGI